MYNIEDMPEVDYTNFISTMSQVEKEKIYRDVALLYKEGKSEEAGEAMRKWPLYPHLAIFYLLDSNYGKEYLLRRGYNLADAEKYFGEDWMEKYGQPSEKTMA